MLVIMNVDYKKFRRPPVVFTFLGITSLLLIVVFLFRDSHNTHRWIKFGGLSFQPSEVAKPALILYLAYFLGIALAADHGLEERADSGSRAYTYFSPC